MDKNQKLEYIWGAIKAAYPNRRLVFSDGSPDAQTMMIGEAPGVEEEKQGKPFIGRAGRLLNATLELLGWQRSDFYISNIVKYRPQDAMGGTLTPTPEEIEKFRPSIEKEIEIVNPKLIVVLGRIAMTGLGIEGNISTQRGQVVERNGRRILIVYHPAAILRNINLEPAFREDLGKMTEVLIRSTTS